MGMVEKHRIIMRVDVGGILISISGVPTTITTYSHGLGIKPGAVFITHTDYGTTGIVREIKTGRSTTGIQLQANLSGVGVDILVVP